MIALLSEVSIIYISAECKIELRSYGSKHSSQFFLTTHLCVLTRITRQLQLIYGRSAYRMTALLSDTFLVWFTVAKGIHLENYGPRQPSVVHRYQPVCVYSKPV